MVGLTPCCARLGVELRKVPPATDRTDPSAHKPCVRENGFVFTGYGSFELTEEAVH